MIRTITLLAAIFCFSGNEVLAQAFKETSVLASGIVHKVSVQKSGVYKIDHAFIRDQLKIDPSTISPDRIAIFSNGGGRIPQWNSADRIDDLEQVATWGFGLSDGAFQSGDYLLWFAEAPDSWTFDPFERIYHMEKNIYDEYNHYYIVINGPQRIAMEQRANAGSGDYVSDKSLVYQRLEEEKVNLLGRFRPPGSGQQWYGDELSVVKELDYTSRFDVSSILPEDTIYYKVNFAARAGKQTPYYFRINDKEASRSIGAIIRLDDYATSFANSGILQGAWVINQQVNRISIRYPDANGPNSRGWIDYIQLNYWRKNKANAGQGLFVRDPRSLYLGNPSYAIEGLSSGSLIWDVSDPFHPIVQEYAGSSNVTFTADVAPSDTPREFYCFHPVQDVLTPTYAGHVASQNLHGIHQADMVIIYYDEFEEAAMKLANHRQTFSNLDVVVVPVSKVVEEFGGGSWDPSGIRDFVRMIYLRDPGFRYLLLVGDATYDFLHRFKELPHHNFVPAFQTIESLNPIEAFPSDDFYALLDSGEGKDLRGGLDIAIGRLPVSSAAEALTLVDKIIHYDTQPQTLQDWRLRLVMVADDEDHNTHIDDAESIAVNAINQYGMYNMNKIYLDAYPQATTPGGTRYPGVNQDIDLAMNKGALAVTYIGHGGPNGWAQERVLGINQVQGYRNINNLPLFITATCTFASYDEPGHTSAGEHLLVNPEGGAIALMTTVRLVYSGSNERLTRSVYKFLLEPDGPGQYPAIGEILRRAKNNNALDTTQTNARKFTLLGDPALVLSYPRYGISVTEINGHDVSMGVPDTISALDKVSVSGMVTGFDGEIKSDFNGKIHVTLYDKEQMRKTLNNDPGSPEFTFRAQNRQLFKGSASVVNGEWTIQFVMPRDMDYSYGSGKLSLYAEDGVTDAAGYFTDFIVGGVSSEDRIDNEPPVVRLFLNDTLFIDGGITNSKPDIYVQLYDDNGINVSGTSIGHDIEAVLDNDDKNSIVLNDFYSALIDDYTQGEVRYPLSGLTPGHHTLRVRAWDVANNPGEAEITFLVVKDESAILKHVLNYPNPFYDRTWFQFEHNKAGTMMDIRIDIHALDGRLVRSLEQKGYLATGYRVEGIEWDGHSQTGNPLSAGMYVYKMYITCHEGGKTVRMESPAGKLVLLQ